MTNSRLPVGGIIRDAYRFTFEHLGAIIGLIWLPTIIGTVLGFFIKQRAFPVFAGFLATGDDARLPQAMLGVFFYGVAFMLLAAMMVVPVMELALGRRKSGSLARFAFGPTEWRLFKTALGLVAFLFASLVVVSMGAGLVVRAMQGRGNEIASLLLVAYLLFFAMRLGFLMPAIVVSEETPALRRSWQLSAGNFWALLAVLLGAVGPVLVLGGIIQLLVEGPAALAQGLQGSALVAAWFNTASQNMPLTTGIDFLLAPLMLGQSLGVAAAAYRALAGQALADKTLDA